jgi:hypothetical protein
LPSEEAADHAGRIGAGPRFDHLIADLADGNVCHSLAAVSHIEQLRSQLLTHDILIGVDKHLPGDVSAAATDYSADD